eukprot:5732841-Pyramimonas_sp.AAC.1
MVLLIEQSTRARPACARPCDAALLVTYFWRLERAESRAHRIRVGGVKATAPNGPHRSGRPATGGG